MELIKITIPYVGFVVAQQDEKRAFIVNLPIDDEYMQKWLDFSLLEFDGGNELVNKVDSWIERSRHVWSNRRYKKEFDLIEFNNINGINLNVNNT